MVMASSGRVGFRRRLCRAPARTLNLDFCDVAQALNAPTLARDGYSAREGPRKEGGIGRDNIAWGERGAPDTFCCTRVYCMRASIQRKIASIIGNASSIGEKSDEWGGKNKALLSP